MNLVAIRLADLKAKLQWSAQGEWSAYIKPEECALLLRELTKPEGNDERVRECRTGQRCSDVP